MSTHREQVEGRAYVRPVNRGVHFVDCHRDQYLEDIFERIQRDMTGIGDGYGYLRLTIEWTPERGA